MIQGRVSATFDALVRVEIRGPSGQMRVVDAVVDTGFNGFLTLPPALASALRLPYLARSQAFLADGSEAEFNVYRAGIIWDGRLRYVKADATGKKPLIGMSLLHRHGLYVEVVEGGRVEVAGLG